MSGKNASFHAIKLNNQGTSSIPLRTSVAHAFPQIFLATHSKKEKRNVCLLETLRENKS